MIVIGAHALQAEGDRYDRSALRPVDLERDVGARAWVSYTGNTHTTPGALVETAPRWLHERPMCETRHAVVMIPDINQLITGLAGV